MKTKEKRGKWSIKKRILAGCLCLVLCLSTMLVHMTRVNASSAKLENGSFESGQTWTKDYNSVDQGTVPFWNTTATDRKIELLTANKGTYIPGVQLTPTAGKYAAELNANEESTLYQTVTTTPSSIYEWGLDHGARNGTDTMALVIGPAQSVAPAKPDKDGRDQLMQMVDWLIAQDKTSVKTSAGMGEHLTVYSKKFAASGTFQDNSGNNAFSLTPSTIYTEEWQIWIMASSKATSGVNPWNSYGSNKEGSAGSTDNSGNTAVDTGKDYLYTVPAGQNSTLFGFVSVGFVNGTNKTYGNFLDNINFQIYHPLCGSTTNHGSGVVGGSNGTTEGTGASEGHTVTVDKTLITYVTDGEPLKIQAVITSEDAKAGCEFVGVYYTVQGEDGNPKTEFLQASGNVIEDTGSLTDAEKAGKWVQSGDVSKGEDLVYTYYLADVTSATDLHFVFIKSPTVTYDSNGGKDYVVDRIYNTTEDANVYSFKPAADVPDTDAGTAMTFIAPYVSKAAEGQNDGWKFMGWLLTGDAVETNSDKAVNADQLGSLLLPAEHTIACDYSVSAGTGTAAAQYMKIYDGNVSLSKTITKTDAEIADVTWKNDGATINYANIHKGLTMIAQWRWRQAFVPQMGSGSTYTDSDEGGTVKITGEDTADTNYDGSYNAVGGKAYYATTDEIITATATAKTGHTFEGWYDANGNLITTNATYSYTETKESVNTFYARFSGSVTQKYIRQVKSGDTWAECEDDQVGTLGRYTYTDAVGNPISSTATAGTGYKFVGWYDGDGNKVADAMLQNNGATISYTTTGDAIYYARFETAYTVRFASQTKQADGTFKSDTVGGKVSVAAVTDVADAVASSKATANSGYRFIGWYDGNGSQVSTDATYSTTTTSANNNVTYYARFEIVYTATVDNQVYLSFIAESEDTNIPSVFDGRNAGTGKNTDDYGLDNKYGNTIATGFKYSINTMTNVSTIQITVNVPASAYIKEGGTGRFTGTGASILTDSRGVAYNKGIIRQISGATTLTYYWDASGLAANTKYGFIIDNLYAPGATATITVNGKDGTKVTNSNGVVNTSSTLYKSSSQYSK